MIQNGLQALLLKIAEKSSKGGKEKRKFQKWKSKRKKEIPKKGKGKGNSSNKGGKGKPYSKQNYQKGEYVKITNLKRAFEELQKDVIDIDNNDGTQDTCSYRATSKRKNSKETKSTTVQSSCQETEE